MYNSGNNFVFPEANITELGTQINRIADDIRQGNAVKADTNNPGLIYPTLGGVKVKGDKLLEFRDSFMQKATDMKEDSLEKQERQLSHYLYQSMSLAPYQSGHKLMWAALATYVLPDYVVSRFQSHDIAVERFKGGRRNALSRLWFRAHCIPEDVDQQYAYLLNQDLVQQIIERPSLSTDRRCTIITLEAIDKYRNQVSTIRDLYRMLLKEISYMSVISATALLTEDQLRDEIYDRARKVARKLQ